ncbi:MAG: valine--tRNA ligase [Candidatus Xenobia bacterium]
MELPQKYEAAALERKWGEQWEAWKLYAWDPTRPREETFIVDTPPPTVSGSLHVGHVFSYTHQDLLVRWHRMKGMNIGYPMGWDDNGLPTERRVQNMFKIKCNPTLPYDANWQPKRDKAKDAPVEEVSRKNFIEACGIVTREDEAAFEAMWRRLGLSLDWQQQYATIDAHCRRVSQYSFLDLVQKGQVYQSSAPTMWDLDFQTAVAQAEVEDRVKPGNFHDIRFQVEGGGDFVISTTRPELLVACIAVVAHPDDKRYQPLFGKTAITPLFHAPVPIMPAEHADPEKGTGILMVCTFGDLMDVEFWKKSKLPLKQVIGSEGRMLPVRFGEGPFVSRDNARAQATWDQLGGQGINQVRKKMAELLREDGSLVGDLKPIEHPVKFYEKGERALEFLPTRQWFIKILEHKDPLLQQGRKITWHPSGMRMRYENWVEGLNQDWCVSRQRYFGVPIPVWYPITAEGRTDYEHPIFARADALPVDPLSDAPPGYQEKSRGQAGGFTGDPDVMDTWATSSLTPQIVSGWPDDMTRHKKLFPMDVRPQSHEIIRTWAFYTIVKAWMHEGEVPWHHVTISGWILDPDRKKMSKSAGNVVTPSHLIDQYSADAVRYWAARARLGVDTAYDEQVFKVGGRLCTKLFNASKFVLQVLHRAGVKAGTVGDVSDPLDVAFLAALRETVEGATNAFVGFDYAGALQQAEEAFWDFCDNYLELVKRRAYEETDTPGRRSALATLRLALRTFLLLFAPTLPYITEEVWSWEFATDGRERSVHSAPWPSAETLGTQEPEGDVYGLGKDVLSRIRTAKTNGKRNLRWPVASLEIRGSDAALALFKQVVADVLIAGAVAENGIKLSVGEVPEGERLTVAVTLGEEAPV